MDLIKLKTQLHFIGAELPIYTQKLISTSIYLIVGYVAVQIVNNAIKKLLHRFTVGIQPTKHLSARFETLHSVLRSTSSFIIWGIVFITILSKWGVDITPIITGAGILGLAVGFGSQKLVQDVVTGFFLLLENQFNVEDVVEIAGVKGTVKHINLRTTTIVSPDGAVHIIPNGQIAKVSKNIVLTPPEEAKTSGNPE